MTELVNRIHSIMSKNNLSSSAFADTIGVQRSAISHILSGRNKPSLDFVLKILKAYPDISSEWLLLGKKDSETQPPPTLFQSSVNTADEVQMDQPNSQPTNHEPSPVRVPEKKSPSTLEKVILIFSDGSFVDYHPTK